MDGDAAACKLGPVAGGSGALPSRSRTGGMGMRSLKLRPPVKAIAGPLARGELAGASDDGLDNESVGRRRYDINADESKPYSDRLATLWPPIMLFALLAPWPLFMCGFDVIMSESTPGIRELLTTALATPCIVAALLGLPQGVYHAKMVHAHDGDRCALASKLTFKFHDHVMLFPRS